MSIYRRVLRYYRPFLGQTIFGLSLTLVGIGLNLLKPWPFKIIVDDFLRAGSAIRADWRFWILLLCLALIGLQVLWGIINWITNYLFVKIGLQALLKLRTDLYSYLQSLSLKYHDARRSSDSSFRVAYDSQSIQTIYNKGFTNIFGAVITLIGTFVIMLRLDWQLTLGSLLIFSAYLLMLYQPLESLTYTAWAMEGATAGAKRCFEVLDRQDDVVGSPKAIAISSAKGAIAFQAVSFGYAAERYVLRDIDLRIEPNQIVGLAGGTGAGKSTLLSLVPRFYDPTAGSIALDGREIRQITKKTLRAQIAIVLQDTLLFSTTVRENIAYGQPDATEEEIIEAARRAQADEFIREMPPGYVSLVAARGGQLSVGQRQRIGIARAFLKNAPILLLDEPTSALDPATESAIMETIKELMRGRTTLIATHRLATIHNLDQIVVLEHGRIVEQGYGYELVARGGTYAKLYSSGNFPL